MDSAGPGDAKATAPRALQPRMLYLVRRAYAGTRARLDAVTRAHDLTAGDYTMLAFLRRHEPCSAAELSRLHGTTPQATTQQIAQLEGKAMVTREASTANRRISLIRMTSSGRTALEAISRAAGDIEAELLDGFTPVEREAVLAFLYRASGLRRG